MGKAKKGKTTQSIPSNTLSLPSLLTSKTWHALNTSNPNPKVMGPFSNHHKILIIGDGDFSFALSLSVHMGGNNVTATCYDDAIDLKSKYGTLVFENIKQIEIAGGKVFMGVDGTKLEENNEWMEENKYDRIVFNFPHAGGATEEDISKNQVTFFSILKRGFRVYFLFLELIARVFYISKCVPYA